MSIVQDLWREARELKSHLMDYIGMRVSLVKLKLADRISKLLSNIISMVIVVTMMLFFIGFASIALAIGLSKWIGELYLGFMIVSGIYLLVSIILWTRRAQLLRIPILNAILRQMFNENEYKED
jgi:hypothetical protein